MFFSSFHVYENIAQYIQNGKYSANLTLLYRVAQKLGSSINFLKIYQIYFCVGWGGRFGIQTCCNVYDQISDSHLYQGPAPVDHNGTKLMETLHLWEDTVRLLPVREIARYPQQTNLEWSKGKDPVQPSLLVASLAVGHVCQLDKAGETPHIRGKGLG